MFKVKRGSNSNVKFFESVFDAENYAYSLSEKYPSSNIYLEIDKYNSWVTIAKYRDGVQINGVLYEFFKDIL